MHRNNQAGVKDPKAGERHPQSGGGVGSRVQLPGGGHVKTSSAPIVEWFK